MGNNPEGAKRFFAELVKGLGDKPYILMCFFAQPRETWESKFNEYVDSFNQFMPEGVNPTYEVAMPEDFPGQVAKADAIYCHGGDDHLAMYWFEKLKVASVWQGKVVGTNSATTHALAKHFWTCDWRALKDGLGILSIKTLAHFQSAYGKDDPRGPIDWEKAKEELEDYADTSLPVYALPEGEFIVIEQ
jgi:hypothetical protein